MRFEYATVVWAPEASPEDLTRALSTLGADGWEAVGMVTRGTDVMMPGMGAQEVPEVVVLLKRQA